MEIVLRSVEGQGSGTLSSSPFELLSQVLFRSASASGISGSRPVSDAHSTVAVMTSRVLRMSAEELAALIKSKPAAKQLVVIDVRDEDHEGGHIAGSVNVPSDSFYIRQRELIEEYGDYERVVFHCMQSQIRGPRCASIYASQLDEQKHKAYSGTYVLTGGFLGWVYKYKDDPELLENFNPSFWD